MQYLIVIPIWEYEFSEGRTIPISMPYLSGPDICRISMMFGYYIEYLYLSRWQYFDKLSNYCIENDKCSDILFYLFFKVQLSKHLPKNLGVEEINKAHQDISNLILDKINGVFLLCDTHYGGNKLMFLGNQYII